MAPSAAPAQLILPDQFNRAARRAHIAGLDRSAAVKFGAEVLMRAVNALDSPTHKGDPAIGADPGSEAPYPWPCRSRFRARQRSGRR